jgi:hypothetical protein
VVDTEREPEQREPLDDEERAQDAPGLANRRDLAAKIG